MMSLDSLTVGQLATVVVLSIAVILYMQIEFELINVLLLSVLACLGAETSAETIAKKTKKKKKNDTDYDIFLLKIKIDRYNQKIINQN